MVYRGKPGQGCLLCRKRRLPCDQRRPSCSQCLKACRVCPGYYDPKTVRFCHQTKDVVQKARGRDKSSSTTTTLEQHHHLQPAIISNDDRAISHIFTYWVGTIQNPGMLWYVPHLLNATSSSSTALQTTVKALGLASMARMNMVPELRHSAREAYGIALRAINDALLDPALVKSDSTLGAVLLLSFHETITCTFSKMKHTWLNHIRGATNLLELRGEEQLNSSLELELFTFVRISNEISSMLFGSTEHHSPKISELSKLAQAKRDDNSQPIETCYNNLARLNDLSVRFDNVYKSANEKLAIEYLTEALHLDVNLKLWAVSSGPAWHYTVVDIPATQLSNNTPPMMMMTTTTMHGGKYHIYHNISIAGMWNQYRQMRIILNTIIRSISLQLGELQPQRFEYYQQMVSQCNAVIDDLVDDIFASIYFHFISGPPGVAALHWLIWPLFVSSLCTQHNNNKKDSSSSAMRHARILQALDMIAKITGFQEAISFAQIIREGSTGGIIPGV